MENYSVVESSTGKASLDQLDRTLLALFKSAHAPARYGNKPQGGAGPQHRQKLKSPAGMPPSPGSQKPPLSSDDLYRLLSAYLSIGESVIAQPWRLGFGYMRRGLDKAAQSAGQPWDTRRMLGGLLKGYSQFLFETATAGVFAAEAALENLNKVARSDGLTIRDAPRTLGTAVEVDGRPMLLPVRIADASQAWALYYAPAQVVRERLGSHADLFRIFTLADGRAPVAIVCSDFRACDLGTYQEVSLVTFVTPRSQPAAPPGMFFLSLVVNGRFTQEAARRLWDLEKIYAPDLQIAYDAERVEFVARSNGPDNFRISFPRLQGLRSTGVPVQLYSPPQQGSIARRTTLTRNGRNEGMQFGGDVLLDLDDVKADCPCGGLAAANAHNCFCRLVRTLALEKAPVVANGWTEHMSGAFGPAHECRSDA